MKVDDAAIGGGRREVVRRDEGIGGGGEERRLRRRQREMALRFDCGRLRSGWRGFGLLRIGGRGLRQAGGDRGPGTQQEIAPRERQLVV